MQFEFLIPKRPVSGQTRNRANLQVWKHYIHGEAAKLWTGTLLSGIDIRLLLVYLCDEDPVDTDNIIKPIQDALIGLVYEDDLLVADVEAHRRPLTGTFDITRVPLLLMNGLTLGKECVFVRVSEASKKLEDYL